MIDNSSSSPPFSMNEGARQHNNISVTAGAGYLMRDELLKRTQTISELLVSPLLAESYLSSAAANHR